ncbi:hypothetical protein, partial [Enhygromyxa salina]|uniref:hypothetical protein n=1 Tax=Enhygromyxa salina TaxID=215803 RepID=UPI00196A0C4C
MDSTSRRDQCVVRWILRQSLPMLEPASIDEAIQSGTMQTTIAATLLLNLQQPMAPPPEESHAVATVTSDESAEVL